MGLGARETHDATSGSTVWIAERHRSVEWGLRQCDMEAQRNTVRDKGWLQCAFNIDLEDDMIGLKNTSDRCKGGK